MSMSTLTRELVGLEHQFHSAPYGRFTTLGISCLLHAEAVCRAASIPFLQLDDIQRREQREKCRSAYLASLAFLAAVAKPSLAELIVPPEEMSGTSTPASSEPVPPHRTCVAPDLGMSSDDETVRVHHRELPPPAPSADSLFEEILPAPRPYIPPLTPWPTTAPLNLSAQEAHSTSGSPDVVSTPASRSEEGWEVV